jgi:chemotaxis protein CheX
MSLHDLIVKSINESATQVFSTMLGVELGAGEILAQAESPDANGGVVSFIGLAGPWVGTGSVSCSAALACRVCSQMLMTEASAVNEDVLDALAELTNMIIGNVKTDLEREIGPLGLSIPTVVFGRNFKTKVAGTPAWIVVRFRWDEESLIVKMCLAPKDKAGSMLQHSMGHVCAIDV